ncbi:MAG: transporter [Frankiales bacterium]|nr:transporter [Frankiales bacterium]
MSSSPPTSAAAGGGDVLLRVEGLGKDYEVGAGRYGGSTLREQLVDLPKRLVGRGRPRDTRLLTAVDDLTFDVRAGEVLGFVGHNGAGKSTLLKLLSRVTAPSRGSITVRGRVGSLLEVGTGFHPELTGRENVFLNGAVLGMKRVEILRRFDDIVAFSEVGAQLDTPVKRYSSGQFVRLAFSVAAHLEPEVLLVDEVLAVGDASFQRRSLARMGEIARSGSTVLFVSHNMAVVQALCTRALVLQHGRCLADGPVEQAVPAYLRTLEQLQHVDVAARTDRDGRGEAHVVGLRVQGGPDGVVATGGPLRIEVDLSGSLTDTSVELRVHDGFGVPVCSFDSSQSAPGDAPVAQGQRFVCTLAELPLVEGRYRIDVRVRGRGGRLQDDLLGATHVDVVQGLLQGRVVTSEALGRVSVPHVWTTPAPQ